MKWLLLPACLCACATTQVDPARVSIEAQAASAYCGERLKALPILLTIYNGSAGTLRFAVDSEIGPPFELNWTERRPLSSASEYRDTDWEHDGGGHGPMAKTTVGIGPGERITFTAPMHSIRADDYRHSYRFELRDREGQRYLSAPFRLCDAAPQR